MKNFVEYNISDWHKEEYANDIIFPDLIAQNYSNKLTIITKIQEYEYILKQANDIEINNKSKEIFNGDSIYTHIAKLSLLDFKNMSIEDLQVKYAEMIRLTLGKQLFKYIASERFPRIKNADYYIARFYSSVVLGNKNESEEIFERISSCINGKFEGQMGLIIENIKCLYYYRSGKVGIGDILKINESLIKKAKEFNEKTIQSILLLNRFRIVKKTGEIELARSILNDSYETIKDNNLWKQSLYYILQMSLNNEEKQAIIHSTIIRNDDDTINTRKECFSWRITKLLTKSNEYAFSFASIQPNALKILNSSESLEKKYKSMKMMNKN